MWGEFSWPKFVELAPLYLSTTATFVIVFLTWFQIKKSALESKNRETYKFVEKMTQSKEYYDKRMVFSKLKRSGKDLSIYGRPENFHKKESEAIIAVINWWELVGINLKHDGFNEAYIADFFHPTLLDDWKYLKPVIEQLCKHMKDNRIGENVRWLYEEWSNTKFLEK